MKKTIISLASILSILFAQFDSDPRMIGLSGAYTTVATGYQSIGINPANLATNNALSMNLISINVFMVNDFMSVELYNDMNGADFEDPTSSSYYPKDDILSQVNGNEIVMEAGWVAPIPVLNFAYKRIGISMIQRSYMRLNIPKDVLNMMLYGNTTETLIFDFEAEGMSSNEIGLTYAHTFTLWEQSIQVGASFKYLQGLLYLKADDIHDEGSYFQTDENFFSGSGKYLVRQAIGGAGTAIDIGVLLPNILGGWSIGLSLINLGGSISWGAENFTKNIMENYNLPLRQNEYYYFDYEIEPVNAMDMINSEDGGDNPFSSNAYKVWMFTDVPLCSEGDASSLLCLEYDNDDLVPVSNSNIFSSDEIIDIGDDSYLIPSDGLQSSQLQSESSEDISVDYPSFLRIGTSKLIKNYGILSIDLVTGFDESFGNSNKFRISIGTEIIRVHKNFPIRFGCSFGGRRPSSYSIGFGYKLGPLSIDLGRKYYHGLIMNKAKGVEYAINMSLDFNRSSFKNIFKFNLPKIKFPKFPKLKDQVLVLYNK